MRATLFGCAVVVALAVPAAAQHIIAVYDARLGPLDRVNSSGRPLGDLCAVIQQDRANYHRFGKRDRVDDFDPIFGDPAMRSLIPSSCRLESGHEYLRDAVFNNQGFGIIVRVRVLNNNGALQLLVSERAG
ncbi:hypothetical protein [Primorskyibacter flagellatus]|uniref:Uncharacterized protein n=1 Tax=Primorskyibacter flagellatus TaxID=1387277 RepID=A0A1W2E0A3_9RHOB|nr:hypothetical protein [Primorskyibacter flagellatus]SMD02917.1 hypothetical protein SAMN06295998_1204 [Primorskyibacter flagellatus]